MRLMPLPDYTRAPRYPEEFREVIVGAVNRYYDVVAGDKDRKIERERLDRCRELTERLRSLKKL